MEQTDQDKTFTDLWRRFCREAVRAGLFKAGALQNYPRDKRRALLRRYTKPGRWRFWLKNVVEANALGLLGGFKITQPTPTDAKPGSWAKVEALTRRAEAGEELFCDGDPNCLPEGPQADFSRIYKNPETAIEIGEENMSELIADRSIGN